MIRTKLIHSTAETWFELTVDEFLNSLPDYNCVKSLQYSAENTGQGTALYTVFIVYFEFADQPYVKENILVGNDKANGF